MTRKNRQKWMEGGEKYHCDNAQLGVLSPIKESAVSNALLL